IIYCLLSFVSLLSITAHVFHFNLDELVYASGNTNQLGFDPHLIPIFPLLAFFLFYGAGGYLAWKSARQRSSVHAIIMAVLAIGLAISDHANGSLCANAPGFVGKLLPSTFELSSCDHLSSPVNFVRSDSKVLISSIYGAFRDAGKPTVWTKEPSAIQIALTKQLTDVRPADLSNENLVLILVESWGDTPRRPDVQQTILAPILTPRLTASYTLQRGTVPFHGSTTHAELRELCGVDGNFRKITSRSTLQCLPDVLAKGGYAVHGYHGFSYDMFARNRWWPLIGIPPQNMHFMEQIEPQHPDRKCGMAFRGICDADIIADTQSVLHSKQKAFVYILTLNSHLPITIDDKDLARIPCQRLKLDESQCALAVSWHIVMSAVAKLAGSSINPTRFVVVGDHAPPLWSSASAGLFDQKLVPYFILAPRS
ncbi:MAG: sulfatase-like hydrolase/transferase, partial [Rhizomicrobium sp.]